MLRAAVDAARQVRNRRGGDHLFTGSPRPRHGLPRVVPRGPVGNATITSRSQQISLTGRRVSEADRPSRLRADDDRDRSAREPSEMRRVASERRHTLDMIQRTPMQHVKDFQDANNEPDVLLIEHHFELEKSPENAAPEAPIGSLRRCRRSTAAARPRVSISAAGNALLSPRRRGDS